MEIKKPYLIICEGDSEFAYIQELNRFLNEQGLPIVFIAHNAGGGGFKNLRQVCRTLKTRRNGRTFIMADRDIYHRDDNGNGSMYEKEKDTVPPFLFQTWNFEDFLLMHFPAEVISAWRVEAERSGHKAAPLHSSDYMPIFSAFCDDNKVTLNFMFPYEKGDVPFALTKQHIDQLLVNNSPDSFPHSAFADMLSALMGRERGGMD